MQEIVFVVHVERIAKRSAYYLRFPVNDQLINRIKALPDDSRKWNAGMMVWEVSTPSLLSLIKKYRGSNKIYFDFGNEESRKIFISQIKKIEIAEEEKRNFIADLNVKKEHWVKYKLELEETYEKYSEDIHKFLKPGIRLYPHQIVSAMFLNVTRNLLLALDMGTGKSLISIVYAEMNAFEKVFVITPNSLKFTYKNEIEFFTNSRAFIIGKKNNCTIEDAKYIIVNYEYFNSSDFNKVKAKFDNLNIGKIDCLISDECFTYNTFINTNKGQIKIGDIVENELDVKILSYNHELKIIESKSILRYLYNGYKDVIKIKLSNGDFIECTPEHKFYSVDDNIYKSICDFKRGDRLYEKNNLPSMWYRVQTKAKQSKTLFKKMFDKLYSKGKLYKNINNEKIEIFGQKKDRNLSIVRVESIEILESRNRPEFRTSNKQNKRVYDLEIVDNHNYFANGILVSNCHHLKSTSSNTFKNFKRIFKDAIFKNGKVSKVFMSGTPAPSKSAELYSVLHQISPTDFPTKNYFYNYYCGMTYNPDGYGWETNLSMTKFEELFNKIAPFTYRKKKSEVLKDLPEKTYQRIVLDMTPKEYEIYYALEEGIANEFVNKEINNPLSIMGKLREYTSFLKVINVKELIDSILESGEKFVAIDFYKNSLHELHKQYPEISALHTGDQKDTERAEVIKDFQDENGKIKIFLGSEGTTKEGLTLTAASKVGMLTIPWTPGALDQCTDRLARIGQKNAVNAYIFIYKDTIDEYIFNLIEKKRSEINLVIDGEKYESDVNQSIINDLIEIIKEKHKKNI